MFKRKKANTNNSAHFLSAIARAGFTLIELVVAIAILAVLLAVFTPSLIAYIEASRMGKDSAQMTEVVNTARLAISNPSILDEIYSHSVSNNYMTYTDSSGVYGQQTNANEVWAPTGEGEGMTVTFTPDANGVVDIGKGRVNDIGRTTDGRVIDSSKQCNLEELPGLYSAMKAALGNKLQENSVTYKNSSYTIFFKVTVTDEDDVFTDVYGSYNGIDLDESSTTVNGSTVTIPESEKPSQRPLNPEPPSGGGGTTPSNQHVHHFDEDGKCTCGKECNHIYQITKPSTCIEEGTKKCAGCGKTETVVRAAHKERILKAVAATCKSPGKTEGKDCSVCGAKLVEQNTVPQLPHTEVTIPAKPATCIQEGSESGVKCSVCETIITAPTPIKRTGHTPTSANNGVASTCTTPGKAADTKCSVCNTTISKGAALALLDHNFTVRDTSITNRKTEANCYNPAEYYYKCSECGTKGSTTFYDGPLGEHTYSDWKSDSSLHWKDATCGHKSTITSSHSFNSGVETLSPTHASAGTKTFTCNVCWDVSNVTEMQYMFGRPKFTAEEDWTVIIPLQTPNNSNPNTVTEFYGKTSTFASPSPGQKFSLILFSMIAPLFFFFVCVLVFFSNGVGIITPISPTDNVYLNLLMQPYNSVFCTLGGQLAIILLIETGITILANKCNVYDKGYNVILPISSAFAMIFGIPITINKNSFFKHARANGYLLPSIVCFCTAIFATKNEQVISQMLLGFVLISISTYWSTQVTNSFVKKCII